MSTEPPAQLPRTHSARPVTFGPAGQRLFGWYHPPAAVDGRSRRCLVVMSNPFGYEAICTHRHYRALALRLAESGFAVLRYDHHGTGDSAGGDEDPDRLANWIGGIGLAIAFGRQLSGARHVCLFGVRIGATLALGAAAAQGAVDAVIAWAPFASGRAWLREMRALQSLRDAGVGQQARGGRRGEEMAGYLLGRATAATMGRFDPTSHGPAPAPEILLLARDDVAENPALQRRLEQLGSRVTGLSVPGYSAMMRDTFDAVVPLAAFAEIRAWLEARYLPQAAAGAMPDIAAEPWRTHSFGGGSGAIEAAVHFGAGESLFGILCRPLATARRGTGIVFVTVGSNHHIGPNRMYVTQARALAARGFVSLRMDIGGVGESPPAPGQRENHLYGVHSLADVDAAVQYLQQRHSLRRVVLIGLCSGAYLAFHAATSNRAVTGLVLINPQTFTWKEGDSLQLRSRRSIRAVGFYRSRLFARQTWRRLLQGHINAGIIIGGMFATLGRRLKVKLSGLFPRRLPTARDSAAVDVRGGFIGLLRRGVTVQLIYSTDDGGLDEMETHLGRNASALRGLANFRLHVVDGADHTFASLRAQRRLLRLVAGHLLRHHRGDPADAPPSPAAEQMDGINRQTWRRPDSVSWFSGLQGWTDAGERAAVGRVAAEVRDQPILDLGVGAGRTVPLLLPISPDYTALDYTPELAAVCRSRYPALRILDGDARDLSRFADASFALVVFSFNGIDSVNPADRLRILAEVRRVLRDGGIFLFSTHNRQGPGHGERLQLGIYPTRSPLKLLWRTARALAAAPSTLSNYRRYTRLNQQAEGYSIMNAAAHRHGILVHYITIDRQRRQLACAGFLPEAEVYGNRGGRAIRLGESGAQHTWLHFIARKPSAAARPVSACEQTHGGDADTVAVMNQGMATVSAADAACAGAVRRPLTDPA